MFILACLLGRKRAGIGGNGRGQKEAQSQVVEVNQKRTGLLTCNELKQYQRVLLPWLADPRTYAG